MQLTDAQRRALEAIGRHELYWNSRGGRWSPIAGAKRLRQASVIALIRAGLVRTDDIRTPVLTPAGRSVLEEADTNE